MTLHFSVIINGLIIRRWNHTYSLWTCVIHKLSQRALIWKRAAGPPESRRNNNSTVYNELHHNRLCFYSLRKPANLLCFGKKRKKKKDRDAKDIRTLTELDPLVRQNKNRSLTIVQMIVVWKKECCEYDPQNTIRTVGTV